MINPGFYFLITFKTEKQTFNIRKMFFGVLNIFGNNRNVAGRNLEINTVYGYDSVASVAIKNKLMTAVSVGVNNTPLFKCVRGYEDQICIQSKHLLMEYLLHIIMQTY